jgi:putative ABC transport system substrate-binding protein
VGAGLVSDLGQPRPLVTGTCDAWPYRSQLELIRQVLPQARRLGVLYNPGEAASQYGIKKIRELAPELGFEVRERAAGTTAEVYPAAASLVDEVDALFLSSDNTVIGGVAGAVKVAVSKQKPLFVGDSGTVAKGGIGAVSVGYHQLGRQTGELVDRMLRGERNLPVVVATGDEIYLNREAARQMGVSLPPELEAKATRIYTEIEG